MTDGDRAEPAMLGDILCARLNSMPTLVEGPASAWKPDLQAAERPNSHKADRLHQARSDAEVGAFGLVNQRLRSRAVRACSPCRRTRRAGQFRVQAHMVVQAASTSERCRRSTEMRASDRACAARACSRPVDDPCRVSGKGEEILPVEGRSTALRRSQRFRGLHAMMSSSPLEQAAGGSSRIVAPVSSAVALARMEFLPAGRLLVGPSSETSPSASHTVWPLGPGWARPAHPRPPRPPRSPRPPRA